MTSSDHVTASIYAALLGEIAWQQVVDEVAALTEADMATLLYHDAADGTGAITLGSGIPDDIQRDYASHYAARNPWMERIRSIPVGLGTVGDQVVPYDQLRRSEYYNDFLRPNEQESSVGVTIRDDDGCVFILSTLSGDTDLDRNLDRARHLTHIAPHLARVSAYYRRSAAAGMAGFAEGIGRGADLAVIVVNIAGRLIHTSATADLMLDAGNLVRVGPSGRVRFCDPLAESTFAHALKGRFADLLTKALDVGDTRVTFVQVAADSVSSVLMGGALTVLIGKREIVGRRADQDVASRFGLTRAERRVFEGIVAGKRPSDIAREAGVAKETVRSQLKAVYGKTGTNRQSALVRLAAGLGD